MKLNVSCRKILSLKSSKDGKMLSLMLKASDRLKLSGSRRLGILFKVWCSKASNGSTKSRRKRRRGILFKVWHLKASNGSTKSRRILFKVWRSTASNGSTKSRRILFKVWCSEAPNGSTKSLQSMVFNSIQWVDRISKMEET